MNDVLTEVLPLALAGSISPLTATVGILILTSRRRPLAGTAVYLLGNLTVLAVVGLGALALFHRFTGSPAPRSEANALVDLFIGLLLLYFVIRSALKPPRSDAPPGWLRGFDTMGLGRAFLLGLGVLVMNASTLIVYIPAVRTIANAHLAPAATAALLALTVVIVMSWLLIPFLLALLLPTRSAPLLRDLNGWIGRHSRAISLLLFLVFSLYFLAKGIGELT